MYNANNDGNYGDIKRGEIYFEEERDERECFYEINSLGILSDGSELADHLVIYFSKIRVLQLPYNFAKWKNEHLVSFLRECKNDCRISKNVEEFILLMQAKLKGIDTPIGDVFAQLVDVNSDIAGSGPESWEDYEEYFEPKKVSSITIGNALKSNVWCNLLKMPFEPKDLGDIIIWIKSKQSSESKLNVDKLPQLYSGTKMHCSYGPVESSATSFFTDWDPITKTDKVWHLGDPISYNLKWHPVYRNITPVKLKHRPGKKPDTTGYGYTARKKHYTNWTYIPLVREGDWVASFSRGYLLPRNFRWEPIGRKHFCLSRSETFSKLLNHAPDLLIHTDRAMEQESIAMAKSYTVRSTTHTGYQNVCIVSALLKDGEVVYLNSDIVALAAVFLKLQQTLTSVTKQICRRYKAWRCGIWKTSSFYGYFLNILRDYSGENLSTYGIAAKRCLKLKQQCVPARQKVDVETKELVVEEVKANELNLETASSCTTQSILGETQQLSILQNIQVAATNDIQVDVDTLPTIDHQVVAGEAQDSESDSDDDEHTNARLMVKYGFGIDGINKQKLKHPAQKFRELQVKSLQNKIKLKEPTKPAELICVKLDRMQEEREIQKQVVETVKSSVPTEMVRGNRSLIRQKLLSAFKIDTAQ